MKIYNKLVEKLSTLMFNMVAASEFTYEIVMASFNLSALLLRAGRVFTRIALILIGLAAETAVISASLRRWLSVEFLAPEQSRRILIVTLLFFDVVLVVRFLALLIWDATKKMVGMK